MGLSRRRFLELAAAGVALGLAGCESTLRPSFGRVEVQPLGPRKLASRAALTSTPTAIPMVTADGGESVFAYVEGEEVVALSSLCTHRGCTVAWDGGAGRFACPCHAGYFDRAGQVLDGPPLAPLKAYAVRDVGGELYIEA